MTLKGTAEDELFCHDCEWAECEGVRVEGVRVKVSWVQT